MNRHRRSAKNAKITNLSVIQKFDYLCRNKGLPLVIDFHTHRPTPAGVFTPRSFGVHPWDSYLMPVPPIDDACWQNVDFVGECGLDRCKQPSIDVQMACFEKQLIIAEKLSLPVVVHCVRAFDILLAMRKQHGATPWILHGFVGGTQQAEQLAQHRIYVSIGAALFDERRAKVRDTLMCLGSKRLLLETDDSGADINLLYHTAASLLGIPFAQLESDIEVYYRTLSRNV